MALMSDQGVEPIFLKRAQQKKEEKKKSAAGEACDD